MSLIFTHMFCLCNVNLILVVTTLFLIFSMQLIEVSKKAIIELEERVVEAEGELQEALACMSSV